MPENAVSPKENEGEEYQDGSQGKVTKGKHNDGAADLEKVTDYVEEQEISALDIQKVMNWIDSMQTNKNCRPLPLKISQWAVGQRNIVLT